MNKEWDLALGVLIIGTWLLRALPLWWTRRHLQQQAHSDRPVQLPTWLTVAGPMMIAGMLGVSLLPAPLTIGSSIATLLGVAVTILVWRRTQGLGWPVVSGVACFGFSILLMSF